MYILNKNKSRKFDNYYEWYRIVIVNRRGDEEMLAQSTMVLQDVHKIVHLKTFSELLQQRDQTLGCMQHNRSEIHTYF